MRDIDTVRQGERVYVHKGIAPAIPGVYVGFVDGHINVDHTVSYSKVSPTDVAEQRFVTDAAGRVLRPMLTDPDLNGTPPDLE